MTVSLAYIRVDVFDDSCNALAESMAVRNIAVLLIELCIGLEHVVHPLCRRCYQVDGLLAEQTNIPVHVSRCRLGTVL